MKYKQAFLSVIFGFLLSCDTKNDKVEVGEVTERTAEEIASHKDFAPEFAFNSMDGKLVSLKDLKGKYVYVDIWATWCRPCIEQLPAMKELEEKYRGQDLEFLSISVDNERDKEKWKRMVNEKEMTGIQLYAGTTSTFHKDYQIKTIPKFLILGKDGEIIDNNPPRPMDYSTRQINHELVAIFDNLLNK